MVLAASLRGAVLFCRIRCLRDSQETGAKRVELGRGEAGLDFGVGALPDGRGAGEQVPALCGQNEGSAAAIALRFGDADEAAALEGLEGGGEGGAVHGQQAGNGRHGRRLGLVQRHEQGKLPIGQAEGAEGPVETAGQGAGGALGVEA